MTGKPLDTRSKPLLEARGLALRAGSRVLVQGLELTVRDGERWCVIGRNGVGKSSLLRAFAGLPIGRSEGSVLWRGIAVADWRADAAAAHRALMGQHASDRFSISVRRLLDLAVAAPGRRTAGEVLASLDASHLVDADASRLSGGERQRVALAQCILQGAPLMLLDEPVSFQDPAHQAVVARWLADANPLPRGALGSEGFIIAAHDVNWISRVATHVLALRGDGAWRAGPAVEMLVSPVLEEVYGCRWQCAGGVFLPID